jgi:hypothetical protein
MLIMILWRIWLKQNRLIEWYSRNKVWVEEKHFELDRLAMNDEKKPAHELLICNEQREERQEREAAKNI